MPHLEEVIREFIEALPKGFIPRREKFLLFSGGVNETRMKEMFTINTAHYIALIAKSRGVPLDYSFSTALHSRLLDQDLRNLRSAELLTWGSPITPTDRGWLVIEIFRKELRQAEDLYKETKEFAEGLFNEIGSLNETETLRSLRSTARQALHILLSTRP